MPPQDVWKFTPVSYRTSALWGRCPALTPLLQLITSSRASGTADHVQSLDDLFHFIFITIFIFIFLSMFFSISVIIFLYIFISLSIFIFSTFSSCGAIFTLISFFIFISPSSSPSSLSSSPFLLSD